MRERIKETKAAARGAEGEREVLAKIAEMPDADRVMAERLHEIVKATVPELTARTYYGMPAYAKDDKVLCFFKGAYKFKTRYATLGFSDKAKLDEGGMWPTDFALTKLTKTEEKRIVALLQQAVA
jgi:uncharacterized protein YdhG (YjbR/CyaY superfamily)